MASRLADLSRASEESQTNQPSHAKGAPPKKNKECIPHSTSLPTSMETQLSRTVDASGERLTVSPTTD